MADHGPRLGGEDLGTDFGWTGEKKLAECHGEAGQGPRARSNAHQALTQIKTSRRLDPEARRSHASTTTGANEGVRTTTSAASITTGARLPRKRDERVGGGRASDRSRITNEHDRTRQLGNQRSSTARLPPDLASGERLSYRRSCRRRRNVLRPRRPRARSPQGKSQRHDGLADAARLTVLVSPPQRCDVSRASVTSVRT